MQWRVLVLLWCVVLCLTAIPWPAHAQPELPPSPYCQQTRTTLEQLRCELALALQGEDLDEIERPVALTIDELGVAQGVPEVPDRFDPISPDVPLLTAADVPHAFDAYADAIEANAWWTTFPDPTTIPRPLRAPADVVIGSLAARRAGAGDPDRLLAIARDAGEYLLWAQQQGGCGVFPFPNWYGRTDRLGQVNTRFLDYAAAYGMRDEVLVNDWMVDDLGDGGLQFDNGLAGVAVLELYVATGELRYLDSGLAAAEYALGALVVPNWNYNSFSVYLLARAYRVTGDARYLEGAKLKARLGIYPGQLRTGAYAGRWADPHNARLVYHYILIRGLGELVAALPPDDPDLPLAVEVLTRALDARNAEIAAQGASHPATTLEVLSRLAIDLPPGDERLPDAGRGAALDVVGRYATARYLRGEVNVGGVAAWGLYLEAVTAGAVT
ncbi:MAG: hypothetical protein GYB65_17455 [Chloroflexi bacterium]|nr:hypothetical protein [Chloroflexota bacterium]